MRLISRGVGKQVGIHVFAAWRSLHGLTATARLEGCHPQAGGAPDIHADKISVLPCKRTLVSVVVQVGFIRPIEAFDSPCIEVDAIRFVEDAVTAIVDIDGVLLQSRVGHGIRQRGEETTAVAKDLDC